MADFRDLVAKALGKALPPAITNEQVSKSIETPPDRKMGDYAFPCFSLSPLLKKSPQEIAKELKGKVGLPKGIERVEAAGPYLNFFVSKKGLAKETISGILAEKDKYGRNSLRKGDRILVEYSSPNTNKPLHIGHTRNDSLGMAVSKILENSGAKVVRANLLNDRGIHICQSMLAYMRWSSRESPKVAGIKGDRFVGNYYTMFAQKAKEDDSFKEQAQRYLRQWEAGDKEIRKLWKTMSGWALEGFKQTYKEFGSEFDVWFKESEFYNKAKPIIDEGIEKKIFRKNEQGALVADLDSDKDGIPNKTVLRSDGTSIYLTNDLALTKHKFQKYRLDEAIWVVASEQNLYFRQLFRIFEKLGYKWSGKCKHLSYGMVFLPEGRLKSREGRIIEADELLEMVKALARKEIEKRHKLPKHVLEMRISTIALAAIKFFMLRIDASKDMVFDMKKAVSFDGETGPYVQYTYARAKSILRKYKKNHASPDYSLMDSGQEHRLVSLLAEFPSVVEQSTRTLSPHTICHCLISLSEAFNSFYHSFPVLEAEPGLREARVELVEAVSQVLKNGLALLNIDVLEEM